MEKQQNDLNRLFTENIELKEDHAALQEQVAQLNQLIDDKDRAQRNTVEDLEEVKKQRDKARLLEDHLTQKENDSYNKQLELGKIIDDLENKLKWKENDTVKMSAELNFLRNKQNNTIESLEQQTDSLEKETLRMR